MTTYSDHQQRLLDQGASFDRVREARRPMYAHPGATPSEPETLYSVDPCGCIRDAGGTVTGYCMRHTDKS